MSEINQTQTQIEKLAALQTQGNDVAAICRENVRALTVNVEHLEDLENKATELEDKAIELEDDFRDKATEFKCRHAWQTRGIAIAFVLLLVAMLSIILCVSTNACKKRS